MADATEDGKDKSIQASDDPKAQRLNKQHTLATDILCGGRLIHDANIALPPNANVLDVGTGTGIWLLEVAQTLPATTQLFGIDSTTKLFPQTTPSNAHFLQHSVSFLPESWTDKFHFIHQRYLVGAVRKDEWPTAMSELFRVLSPGDGRVQLMEPMDIAIVPTKGVALPTGCTRFNELMVGTFAKSRHDMACGESLPRLLVMTGFVDVRLHIRPWSLGRWAAQNGTAALEVLAAGWRSIADAIAQVTGGTVTAEEYLKLIDLVVEELDKTPGLHMFVNIIEASKPVV